MTQAIPPTLTKELREKTGAPMMDCKKALEECKGDIEQATNWLRAKGITNAAKRAGNVSGAGVVAVIKRNFIGAMIELNSQTDFVARNGSFQTLATKIVQTALKVHDLESLHAFKIDTENTVEQLIKKHIATIGENIILRRMKVLQVNKGLIASYIHNKVCDNIGLIGVLVAIESDIDPEKLQDFGQQIAMHIAAASPSSIDVASLDAQLVQREKDVFIAKSQESGKPANVIEKMVEGRMRKFYEESVLLEQIFIKDGETKIVDLIAKTEKELGGKIKIKDFANFKVGEGIEKQTTNFAEEVNAMSKK